MAFSTFIVYFEPRGTGANESLHRGLWVRAVASAADGRTYIANSANVNRIANHSVYGEKSGNNARLLVSSAAVDIPPFAQPIISIGNDGTESVSLDSPPAYYHDKGTNSGSILQTPRFSNLLLLKTGLRTWHNRLHELYTLLNQVGPNYPQADVNLGHSILYRLHQGTYLVARDTDITLANRLAWLAASAQGPADTAYNINDPETFFEIAAAITSSTLRDSTHPLEVAASETRTVSRTDFTLGDRLSIAQMLDSNHAPDGDVPSVSDLKRGGWIDEVTE